MNLLKLAFFGLIMTSSLFACTSMPLEPSGPSVLVLPGDGKSFDQFRVDEKKCRHYGFDQVASIAKKVNGFEAQQRYDMSYIQCMFAHGNRVPVSGNFIDEQVPND